MIAARAYAPEDFALVAEWAKDRGLHILPEFMGQTGFVVEDENGALAVLMVYLMFDVPIAVVDNFITRPGLIGRQVKTAWESLWRMTLSYLHALEDGDGRRLRYRLVRTYCSPKIAPVIAREGWQLLDRQSQQISYALD